MAGFVSSYFEQYTGTTQCGTTPSTPISNCLLWVIVGVVVLSIGFEKKRKVPQK
jgi:hypothetical protein